MTGGPSRQGHRAGEAAVLAEVEGLVTEGVLVEVPSAAGANGEVVAAPVPDGPVEVTPRSRHVDGAAFVFAVGEAVPAVWGEGRNVLWAEGEPFLIVGPDGVGKTTIAQQLVLARIGIRRGLLGLPVTETAGTVVYLACDRPRQAASSLRRMVTPGGLRSAVPSTATTLTPRTARCRPRRSCS